MNNIQIKTTKKIVQISCTAYIVYTFHLSLHYANFGQFKVKQLLCCMNVTCLLKSAMSGFHSSLAVILQLYIHYYLMYALTICSLAYCVYVFYRYTLLYMDETSSSILLYHIRKNGFKESGLNCIFI